jgi:transposase
MATSAGSKVHRAVDTPRHLLAVQIATANEQERAQVRSLAQEVRRATGETVKITFVDRGDTGQGPAQAAREEGIPLHGVKLPEAGKGFAWPPLVVVERSFGWIHRLRRLACGHEHLPETLAGPHFVVFTILMPSKAAAVLQRS